MFSHRYLLGKLRQKRFFFDILNTKECFLNLKSEIINKSEKSKFSKGISPWFCPENNIFSHGYFWDQKKFVF